MIVIIQVNIILMFAARRGVATLSGSAHNVLYRSIAVAAQVVIFYVLGFVIRLYTQMRVPKHYYYYYCYYYD